MNRNLLKIKQIILSAPAGQWLRDAVHARQYTYDRAKAAAQRYYGNPDEIRVRDMLNEAKKHHVLFSEYHMYHFEELSEKERREFIPLREAQKFKEKWNTYYDSELFYRKGDTYRKFEPYFKRELIEIKTFSDTEKATLKDLCSRNERLIYKPYDGAEGHGIQIIPVGSMPFNDLWNRLKTEYTNGVVVEEVITQDGRLSAINPDSINTLRIATVVVNGCVNMFPAVWRCGRKGSVVDNGGSGGVFCGLSDTGVIVGTSDENGMSYSVHPDTGEPLLGFQIPRFEEAVALAKELAFVCPKVRYVGWDLALTPNGWIMIEGNADGGFMLWQSSLHQGCRPFVERIMKELEM